MPLALGNDRVDRVCPSLVTDGVTGFVLLGRCRDNNNIASLGNNRNSSCFALFGNDRALPGSPCLAMAGKSAFPRLAVAGTTVAFSVTMGTASDVGFVSLSNNQDASSTPGDHRDGKTILAECQFFYRYWDLTCIIIPTSISLYDRQTLWLAPAMISVCNGRMPVRPWVPNSRSPGQLLILANCSKPRLLPVIRTNVCYLHLPPLQSLSSVAVTIMTATVNKPNRPPFGMALPSQGHSTGPPFGAFGHGQSFYAGDPLAKLTLAVWEDASTMNDVDASAGGAAAGASKREGLISSIGAQSCLPYFMSSFSIFVRVC